MIRCAGAMWVESTAWCRGEKMNLKQIIAGCLGAAALLHASESVAANIDISAHDIGGRVHRGKRPEGGGAGGGGKKDLPTKHTNGGVYEDQRRPVISRRAATSEQEVG